MPEKNNFNFDVPDIDLTGTTGIETSQSVEVQATQEVELSQPIDEDDINIGDKKAPIIMLFGPPSSGKSMTLVRLARYLRKNGYTVKADYTFKSDAAYKMRCENFHASLNTKEALVGTGLNEFLMLKIIKHGNTVCQILEAPGEHYFNPKKPNEVSPRNFRPYLTTIIRKLSNRKIWIFITEAEWNVHASVKDAYVSRINGCKHQLLNATDRVIILYNKVDKKEELFESGKLHISAAEKAMKDEYEGLAPIFKNPNPITSLWRSFNYSFVPFCTGYYTEQNIGERARYNESEEHYPKHLWAEIMKCLKG